MNIYKILTILITISLFSFNTYAINKYKVVVEDNKYIDSEAIFALLDKFDPNLSDEKLLNQLSKKLYETGNFEKVDIIIENDTLIISLKEYYSVNNIKFVDNERFKKDQLLEVYELIIEQKYLNPRLINIYIDEIKDMYRSFGYNQIDITYQIKETNNDNIVDLYFYFKEGKISKINKVIFEGNNNFKKSQLLDLTSSKPRRELLFFLRKNFKEYVFKNDINRLLKFYRKKGYKDISIDTKTEYIESKNKFNLYYIIDEGKKYSFNNLEYVINSNNISLEDEKNIDLIFDIYKKDLLKKPLYNPSILLDIKSELSNFLFSLGLNFFEISILEKVDENKVDILFRIQDMAPKYANQILIKGNYMTQDKVIRREMEFAEGDPINNKLIKDSIDNIKSLGFFKSVDIREIEKDNNYVDIVVEIEEQKTGDFSIGVSFSSLEGATFLSKLNQKNIAGTGRNVDLTINTASNNTEYGVSISEPRFFNKKFRFNYGINHQYRDYSTESSYKISKTNVNADIEFDIQKNLSNSIGILYELNNYDITDTSAVSSNLLSNSGTNAVIKLNNTLNYYDLDSFFRPTTGNNFILSTSISPVTNSKDGFVQNVLTLKKFMNYEDYIFSFQSRIGNIFSLQNEEISNNEKFALGGRWLRGFDISGVGPRNSRTSYIGGNNLIVGKLDISKTLFSNTDNPIDFFVFGDAGKVFDNKTKPTHSKESVRTSVGYGLKIYSPIGPIGLSWGFPMSSETYDIKREFLFSIGNIN